MRQFSLAALLFLQCVFAFAQYTPSTVPNVKLINNSYVSNPDAIISESSVATIDSTLYNLEQQTTAQVAVVVLKSIGDVDDFSFAHELFNLWGIGSTNSNGLLILFVEDRHIVRFQTGDGIEGILPDVVCKKIQREQMIPSFKEGDYDNGIINGVKEVSKIVKEPAYAEEIRAALTASDDSSGYSSWVMTMAIFFLPIFLITWATKSGKFADSKPADPTFYPQMRLKRWTWLTLFGIIPALITIYYGIVPTDNPSGNAFWTLYFYLEATVLFRMFRERRMIRALLAKEKYFSITDYYRQSVGYYLFIAFVFPLPLFFYFFYHIIRKKMYRNHSRKCKLCNGNMKRLSEKDEDAYLTKSQQLEEQLKSVDYDVWKCKECGATESWHFLNRHSAYKPCPSCKAVAYFHLRDKTITAATYTRSGKGETIHQCKACGKEVKETYSIAQLTHSSTSGGSSSGSSYSSSSSGSSGGGSWGGGHSSGGGASSSW